MNIFRDLWDTATERLEGITEDAAAGLLSGIRGTSGQVETGDNGKGGTVVEASPSGMPVSSGANPLGGGMPGWVVPAAAGVGAVVVVLLLVKVVR